MRKGKSCRKRKDSDRRPRREGRLPRHALRSSSSRSRRSRLIQMNLGTVFVIVSHRVIWSAVITTTVKEVNGFISSAWDSRSNPRANGIVLSVKHKWAPGKRKEADKEREAKKKKKTSLIGPLVIKLGIGLKINLLD